MGWRVAQVVEHWVQTPLPPPKPKNIQLLTQTVRRMWDFFFSHKFSQLSEHQLDSIQLWHWLPRVSIRPRRFKGSVPWDCYLQRKVPRLPTLLSDLATTPWGFHNLQFDDLLEWLTELKSARLYFYWFITKDTTQEQPNVGEGAGGEMTQTMYAHVNKWIIIIKKNQVDMVTQKKKKKKGTTKQKRYLGWGTEEGFGMWGHSASLSSPDIPPS
jgi:hypothetical protein